MFLLILIFALSVAAAGSCYLWLDQQGRQADPFVAAPGRRHSSGPSVLPRFNLLTHPVTSTVRPFLRPSGMVGQFLEQIR